MTLITCTPYMINSHRLLVRGIRVEESDKVNLDIEENNSINDDALIKKYIYKLIIVVLIICIIVIVVIIIVIKRGKKVNEEI